MHISHPLNTKHSGRTEGAGFTDIPVVDISDLFSSSLEDRQAVADQLEIAASQVGFLYICGHQIEHQVVDALIKVSKAFFDQSLDKKMTTYIGRSSNHSGYVPEGEEAFYNSASVPAQVDHKESFDVGFEVAELDHQRPMLGLNNWPDQKGFREAVSFYFDQMIGLSKVLFRGFALALGLPENAFEDLTQRPPNQLRLIHYPFDPNAEDREGIGAHTDYECFTLLLPTADGLEVLNSDGKWIDAPVRPGCFVVNIGDMLELISNGRFVATSHRVRKVKEERYSFPMFCSLDYDAQVKPLLPPLPGADPAKYQPLVCGEHIYAQTVQTFRYLKERLAKGDIQLPDSAQGLGSFGQYKAVVDEGGAVSGEGKES